MQDGNNKVNDSYSTKKEVFYYVVFGGLTFLLNFFLFYFLYRHLMLNEMVANAISWIVCVLFQFVTNKWIVFQSKDSTVKEGFTQMGLFFSGRILTLIIEEVIIFVFITCLRYDALAVKAAAQIIVIIMNYLISKLIVFRR